jgi:hypothetical protein
MPEPPQPPKLDLLDYLKGKPLTPEHAELMDQADEAEKTVSQPAAKMHVLTEEERYYLNTLRSNPGWQVAWKAVENAILQQRESVIVLSQTDPLRNKDEIALQWAYLECMHWAARRLRSGVEAEMGKVRDPQE